MELKDTAAMMSSPDYKERFRAEFIQVDIRCDNLLNMLNKWYAGELTFTPVCDKKMLSSQLHFMCQYRYILEQRAVVEGIPLDYQKEERNEQ